MVCTKRPLCRINNIHEWYLHLKQQNNISEPEKTLRERKLKIGSQEMYSIFFD